MKKADSRIEREIPPDFIAEPNPSLKLVKADTDRKGGTLWMAGFAFRRD